MPEEQQAFGPHLARTAPTILCGSQESNASLPSSSDSPFSPTVPFATITAALLTATLGGFFPVGMLVAESGESPNVPRTSGGEDRREGGGGGGGGGGRARGGRPPPRRRLSRSRWGRGVSVRHRYEAGQDGRPPCASGRAGARAHPGGTPPSP